MRGINHSDGFHLAFNHNMLGQFDDAVLVWKQRSCGGAVVTRTFFIQIKFKQNKLEITKDMLKGNHNKDHFYIKKYSNSLNKVKLGTAQVNEQVGGSIPLEDVTLCIFTNALKEDSLEEAFAGDIISTKSCDIHLGALTGIALSGIHPLFYKSFRLFHGQADKNDMEICIKTEIQTALGTNDNDTMEVLKKVQSGITEWWLERDKPRYLTEKDQIWKNVISERADMLSAKIKSNIESIRLKFKPEVLSKVKAEIGKHKKVCFLPIHKCTMITILKIWQAVNNEPYIIVSCEELRERSEEISKVWKSRWCNIIILQNYVNFNENIEDLLSVLDSSESKRIVIVPNGGEWSPVEPTHSQWQVIEDEFSIQSLDDITLTSVQNTKLNLQGSDLLLRDLVPTVSDLEKITPEQLLLLQNNEKPLKIGNDISKNVTEHYIPRFFAEKTFVKRSVFTALNNMDVCVVYGVPRSKIEKWFAQSHNIVYAKIRCDLNSSTENERATIIYCDTNVSMHQFEELCDEIPNRTVHLLEFVEKRWKWVKTKGKITRIQEHLDSTIKIISADSLMDTSDRVLILDGLPGMGKTTQLKYFAAKLKERNKLKLIITLDFGSLSNLTIEKTFTFSDVIDLLLSACKSGVESYSDLEAALLKFSVETSCEIIVLIDSFDEISPYYTKKGCDILHILGENIKFTKLIIATRPVTRIIVEEVLGSLSFNLQPLSRMKQESFLRSFALSKFPNENVEFFISTSRGLDLKNCLETPLLLRIYAEISTKHCDNFLTFKKIDKYILFKNFFEEKIKIFLNQKCHLTTDNPATQMLQGMIKKAIEYDLIELAVESNFSDKNVRKSKEFITEYEKLGIVFCRPDNTVQWVHKTFAEYYVALWFVKYYHVCRNTIINNIFEPEMLLVRDIFNGYLCCELQLHEAALENDIRKATDALIENEDVNRVDVGGRTSLHLAAWYQSIDVAKMLLDNGADLSLHDFILKCSPLRYAEQASSWNVAELLLSNNASTSELVNTRESIRNNDKCLKQLLGEWCSQGLVNLVRFAIEVKFPAINIQLDTNGNTALHIASYKGHVALVVYLLSIGDNVNKLSLRQSSSPLHEACRSSSVKTVDVLLEKGARVAATDRINETPLHKAIREGSVDVVRRLLDAKADTDKPNAEGMTPVLLAAAKGRLNVLETLLNYGADTKLCNRKGDSLLHAAAMSGDTKIVKFLLQQGLKASARNHKGRTCVHLAAKSGFSGVLELLLQHANDDTTDSDGETPLHLAARKGHVKNVGLLAPRSNVNARNRFGMTPLHVAKGSKVADILVKEEAILDLQDRDGNTPLHRAVQACNKELVQYLVRKGVKINMLNHESRTPLHSATLIGRSDIVYIIEQAGGK